MEMNRHQANLVYHVVRDHRSKTLQRLRSLPSGVLVATGAWIAIRSVDEGTSWQEFGEGWLGDDDIVEIAEQNGCAIVFTKGEENRIRIWKGSVEKDGWVCTCNSWDGWRVNAGVMWGNTLVAGVYDGEILDVLCSCDLAKTWTRKLRLEIPGTLHHFVVSASGTAIAAFLTDTEMLDDSDFESTVITMDVAAQRVVNRSTLRGNIQSVSNSGEHEWLFGANSGLMFSYDSRTHDLQTRAVLDNEELNITGIHKDRGRLVLIAEESDPPGKVWLLREDDSGQWRSFRTGIECYVYGTASVTNGIVVLAHDIYRIDLSG
jgi:hypothetical protein